MRSLRFKAAKSRSMSSDGDPEVELIPFENPADPECRLFIPQIRWPHPEDGGAAEAGLAEFLRERLLPHGLPHSVYVARCTPGEFGNKRGEEDAGRKFKWNRKSQSFSFQCAAIIGLLNQDRKCRAKNFLSCTALPVETGIFSSD